MAWIIRKEGWHILGWTWHANQIKLSLHNFFKSNSPHVKLGASQFQKINHSSLSLSLYSLLCGFIIFFFLVKYSLIYYFFEIDKSIVLSHFSPVDEILYRLLNPAEAKRSTLLFSIEEITDAQECYKTWTSK